MQTQFELTQKQAEYIRNANHRWNVACGAVRSGKSYCQIAYCIPSRLMERRGLRGLRVILGATRANIERNILQPMRDIYGDSIASAINSQNYCKILGEKVYCIGADKISQVSKIRGSEISYCAIDEATDINEEVFEMLKSRLSLPWSCCDITTNPASPNHWFKQFLDSADRGVDIYAQYYTIYDNPFIPEDYVHALEVEYDGSVWYDRYILGLWTLAEGLIYPKYQEAMTDTEFSGTGDGYCVSMDYGTSNPFAALLWERRENVWYAVDELYYSGRDTGVQMTDDEYMTMLNEFAEGVPMEKSAGVYGEMVNKIPVIIDPSAASFIALLRKSDKFKPKPADNEVINGIRSVNTAMHRGLIKISNKCENFLNEVQSYVWDPNSLDDRPIKDNDHLMDAMRYFVQTNSIIRKGMRG